MTAEVMCISVPPSYSIGDWHLAQPLHQSVVLRAEAVVWSVLVTRLAAVVLALGMKSSVGGRAAFWWQYSPGC